MMNRERLSFDAAWKPISAIVRGWLKHNNVSKKDWQEMFSLNNHIASWVVGGSEKLVQALKIELDKHTKAVAKKIHGNNEEIALIRAYSEAWSTYSIVVGYLPEPFNCTNNDSLSRRSSGVMRPDYLEVPFVKQSKARGAMFSMWYGNVFNTIEERLLSAASKLVERDRLGEVIDPGLVASVCNSFVNYELGNHEAKRYREVYEAKYIQCCVDFYQPRATQFIASNGVLQYMQYANDTLIGEEERAKQYLDLSQTGSFDRLAQACANVLVIQFQAQLLAEAETLIENNNIKCLHRLYTLINRTVDGMDTLLDIMAHYIRTESLKALRENAESIVSNCEKYVDQLLEIFNKFSVLIEEAFCNDARFLTVRDQAFQDVVNNTDIFCLQQQDPKVKRGAPPDFKRSELLANYCDLLLRKTALTKKMSSDEIEQKLKSVLLILKYVSNKDVFMRYHRCNLARRLLMELSADQDKEEFLVTKLRECGMASDFISKLNRMLQDVELNKDLCAEFKRFSETGANKTVADCVNLKILNANAWIRGRDKCHVSLPPELEEVIPDIEEFYKDKHSGRKLNWAHNWSTANIVLVNKKGKYDLDVSAFQMTILFAWNSRPSERISLEGLRLATQLSELDLPRIIMSLVSNPRVKEQIVLTDSESPVNPKNFTDSTMFWINQDFALTKDGKLQTRGRVNLINRAIMSQESITDDGVHEEIESLRKLRVQEAIVKIMKMRRVVDHVPLHNEVVDMLKTMFAPNRRFVKQQIEWLIEREFIKRDNASVDKFIYIA